MIPIKKLSRKAIDLASYAYTISHRDIVYRAWRCAVCHAVQVTDDGTRSVQTHCGEEQIIETPAVNRIYPIPMLHGGIEDVARELLTLPIAIVHNPIGNTWGFVLCEIRELRWELTEAYMRLGHLPPYTLIEDGLGQIELKVGSDLNRWILAGAAETTQLVMKRAEMTKRVIDNERQMVLGGGSRRRVK